MIIADFDSTLIALGTWALVVVTIAAVIVGGFAAQAANATFRLEAEPKIVVHVVEAAKIFALGRPRRLSDDWTPGAPPAQEHLQWLDDPVHLVDGKPGADAVASIRNGFTIRSVTPEELNRTGQTPVWPALRVEIRNVGRSPAIQVGLKWSISGRVFASEHFGEEGPHVVERIDEATILVDGIGPNDSVFIWLANATGTPFTLTLKSGGYQRDPLDLESAKIKPLSTIATSPFRLTSSVNSISLG